MRRHHPSGQQQSLPHRLLSLQTEGRLAAPPFAAVPPSQLTSIEHVLDEPGHLRSTVLLGFTRDGSHLISYTTQPVAAADGQEGYCLQLWSFLPGQRCRRLWSVPLFRCQPYLDSLAEEDEFLVPDDMLLTVAEAPDSSLLVVHGRSADAADAANRDQHLTNYLTLIPGPLHAGAAQLQVAHVSYNTAYPHPPFNPYHFITQLDCEALSPNACQAAGSSNSNLSSTAALAIALYAGETVRYVRASVSRQPLEVGGVADAATSVPHLQSRGAGSEAEADEQEQDSSSSSSSFAADEVGGDGSQQQEPLAGQRTPVQPPAGSDSSGGQRQGNASAGSLPGEQRRHLWPGSSSRQQRGRREHQLQQQQQQQQAAPLQAGSPGECGGLEVRHGVVGCAHARPPGACCSGGGGCAAPCGSGTCSAAVCLAAASQHLDLEACLYGALKQQGLPPAALQDYATAPVLGCNWEGQQGLLLLAVLRLSRAQEPSPEPGQALPPWQGSGQQQQPQHRSACVLLHAAAGSGKGAVVEWLQPPYPWHHDLSAFLVQQTAFAGVAFDKAPAFFADFLRSRYGTMPCRRSLPLVLTNRSVLGSGQSLKHIAHPWLPVAILGYKRNASTAV